MEESELRKSIIILKSKIVNRCSEIKGKISGVVNKCKYRGIRKDAI